MSVFSVRGSGRRETERQIEDTDMLTKLAPKVFYGDMKDGLMLFEHCLGFAVGYNDGKLAVVEREGCKAVLVEDAEFAAKEFALLDETKGGVIIRQW